MLYRRTYPEKFRDQGSGELKKTGKVLESAVWWTEFSFAGKRYRESCKTVKKTLAVEYEKSRRAELARQYVGAPAEPTARERIRTVGETLESYCEGYAANHREKSQAWVKERTAHVRRLLAPATLMDLTEGRIRQYINTRLEEGAGGRTINMEVDCLARATGRTWCELWPKLHRLEENRDVGRALSTEEENAILEAAERNRSPVICRFIRAALATGMRSGEIRMLRAGQLDWKARSLRVGRSKTEAGAGRDIPMNETLYTALSEQLAWLGQTFGPVEPDWYLFPFCNTVRPVDPMRPVTTIKTAWNSVRRAAGVECRFHDLRHTALTKMAEAGVPESTMKALAGHMSRAMLERYSHIRMTAKREAVESLQLPARLSIGSHTVSTTVSRKPQLVAASK